MNSVFDKIKQDVVIEHELNKKTVRMDCTKLHPIGDEPDSNLFRMQIRTIHDNDPLTSSLEGSRVLGNNWEGEIIMVNENESLEGCSLYVRISKGEPEPGYFTLLPFDFLKSLRKIYEERTEYHESIEKYIGNFLGPCIQQKTNDNNTSIDDLREIWKYKLSIIWGPPGTGKTVTIAKQAAKILKEQDNGRILIVSTTNKATDEVALDLAKELVSKPDTYRIVRAGKRARYSDFEAYVWMLPEQQKEILTLLKHLEDVIHNTTDPDDKAIILSRITMLRGMLLDPSSAAFLDKWVTISKENKHDESPVRCVLTTVFNALKFISSDVGERVINGEKHFETIFIDEAGLVPIPAAAALSLLGKKRTVLVGDPCQLAPIGNTRLMRQSGLAWLIYQNGTSVPYCHQLTIQYRMDPKIREAVSRYSYMNTMRDADSIEVRKREHPMDELSSLRPGHVLICLLEESSIASGSIMLKDILAKRGLNNRSYERECTEFILDALFGSYPKLADGPGLFITPFRAQALRINRWFGDNGYRNWNSSSVHAQQGAESTFIIFDTVDLSKGRQWHLNGEWKRLLNVAVSRSQRWILILTTRDELLLDSHLIADFVKAISDAEGASAFIRLVFDENGYLRIEKTNLEPIILGDNDDDSFGARLERIKRLRPILTREQEVLCEKRLDDGPQLVRGVAGSGKTVILAHWVARIIKEQASAHSILILYRTMALGHLLLKMIGKVWKERFGQSEMDSRRIRIMHIKDFLNEQALMVGLTRLPEKFQDGKDWTIEYDSKADECLTKNPDQQYDALFIDEAQDFGESTLKLAVHITKAANNDGNTRAVRVFFDNGQNVFGNPPSSWRSLGVDMTGRSTIMRESFRSTKQIIELAFNTLCGLSPGFKDSEEFKQLHKDGIIVKDESANAVPLYRFPYANIQGEMPICKGFNTGRMLNGAGDELSFFLEELRYLMDEKVQLSDIMVITMGKLKNGTYPVKNWLSDRLCECNIQVSFDLSDRTKLRILTPHSSKGYEAEVVWIFRGDKFQPDNAADQCGRLLYTAMTRARTRLYVTWVNTITFNTKATQLESLYREYSSTTDWS